MVTFVRHPSRHLFYIAPLFPVALGLIAGILTDYILACDPVLYLGVVVVATGCAFPFRRRGSLLLLMIAAASGGAGGFLHWSQARHVPTGSIRRWADPAGRIVRLRGTVISEPQVLDPSENRFARWMPQTERTVFLFSCRLIEGEEGWIDAKGRIRVTVYEAVLDLNDGESVEVFGNLHALQGSDNPGSFDWSQWWAQQGVVARINCRHRENIRRIASTPPSSSRSLIARFRSAVRGLLVEDKDNADEATGMLDAMVLGQRSRISRRLNEAFIQSGCAHFLAVSGVHLVIVMYLARVVCFRFRQPARLCAMIVAVVLYTLLAEPRPPILRAAIIALIYCVARLVGRDRACLNWISAAAIVLCVFRPAMIFDVGFQLSFAAVLGVSYLSPALPYAVSEWRRWIEAMLFHHRREGDSDRHLGRVGQEASTTPPGRLNRGRRWLGRYFGQGLCVTVAAWLVAAPIVAVHFYRIQPWGWFCSLLVVPLVTLVMALAFAKIIIGAVSPTGGAAVGFFLDLVDRGLIHFVNWLGGLPYSNMFIAEPPLWLIIFYFAFLLAIVLRFPRNQIAELSPAPLGSHFERIPFRTPRHAIAATLTALVVAGLAWGSRAHFDSLGTVTVLSVGRGSATVIELPNVTVLLYDAGSAYGFDVGAGVVVPFLRQRGVAGIDHVSVSHPNLDHFSGVPTVLEQIIAGPVSLNACFTRKTAQDSPSAFFLKELSRLAHPVTAIADEHLLARTDDVSLERLWPPDSACDALSANDTSTVLRLTIFGHSILLTGDIEDAAQRKLLQRGDLKADVLVLPHHGSVRASTRDFLRAVGAKILVRSSNERMSETYNGLRELTRDHIVYNTADHGAITIRFTRSGIQILTARR